MFSTASVTRGLPLGMSFSPDGQLIAIGIGNFVLLMLMLLLGSESGSISVFDVVTAENVCPEVFAKGHIGPVSDIQWHPTRWLLASLHCNMNFWS